MHSALWCGPHRCGKRSQKARNGDPARPLSRPQHLASSIADARISRISRGVFPLLPRVYSALGCAGAGATPTTVCLHHGGGIATRNDATGALTPTAASPLPVLGFPVVIDAKGRFLFAAGNDSISHVSSGRPHRRVYGGAGLAFCFSEYEWAHIDRHGANGHLPWGGERHGTESW